jgi:hypothetical protein
MTEYLIVSRAAIIFWTSLQVVSNSGGRFTGDR